MATTLYPKFSSRAVDHGFKPRTKDYIIGSCC